MNLMRNKVFQYFSVFMALVYVALGIFVIKSKLLGIESASLNNIFGIILMIYGGFRLYKAYMIIKNTNNENE